MRDKRVFRSIAVGLIIAASLAVKPIYTTPVPAALGALPPLMLWAWERPENLQDLDPGVGVAFLAQTVSLVPDRVLLEPRRQPLKVDPSTVLLATTRIEAPRLAGSALSDRHVDDVTQLIMRTAQLPRVSGIQIDFDATLSQRPFYRRLITSLRKHLPSDMLISMTALASWCVQDRWLQGLEVDEIVPAIFRMGPTNERFREVGTGGSWPAGECRAAVGTSLDEPVDLNGDRRRVYVFSPAPWNAESITAARRLVRQ